jgi:hypothetical protein
MHVLESAWESLKREFDAACFQSGQAARLQTAHELNQYVRRLRQYRTEGEWIASILSGAGKFGGQFALFLLQDGHLRLCGQQNLDLPDDFSFPLASAAAFTTAVESKDAVIALRLPGEVGGTLSAQGQQDRAHLFPITNGSRVPAILFATEAGNTDIHALELIANLGSLVLERQSNSSLHAQIAPTVRQEPTVPNGKIKGVSSALPAWADLDERQRALHIRAQRFSRVTVAEMQLFRPEACRAGRKQANLYIFLKSELDRARETYRKQFMTIPSMVDYLHLELVHTVADGDELKLGADYPGQLV